MKHLVIDARNALPAVDGIQTYLRNTVPGIVQAGVDTGRFRTTILAHPGMASFWSERASAAMVRESDIPPMKPPQNWKMRALVSELRPDLYFYSAHDAPMFVPAPMIFTIHDVTMFRLVPYFESLDRVKRAYSRVVMEVALRRAVGVLTVSETAKREIGEIFGDRFLEKTAVTPHGITGRPPPNTSSTRDRFLYVGTDRFHKNVPRIVRAHALATRRNPSLPGLELVGGVRQPEVLRAIIAEEKMESRVTIRGHVDPPALEEAYARAVALVFPSLAEGFGLPILEAMTRGVPVITSNVSACAEVAGDAAITVDPRSVAAIAGAIQRVAEDEELRTDLGKRGIARAATFTWDRTVQKTLVVVESNL